MKTTLYNNHIRLGGKIVEFAGFSLPLQYESIIKEHLWCRSSCSIFDTSHMTKILFRGDNILSELNHLFTINIANIKDGQCRYCFILNEKGGTIDDVVVYKHAIDEYMVVSNASTKSKVVDWYRANISKSEIIDADEFLDKIDIQGPLSLDVLQDIFKIDLAGLSFYKFGKFNIIGKETVISYSGYTGGIGYEIYPPKENTEKIWGLLLQDERVRSAGLGARDSLRLEAGLPLYGNELDEDTSPFEVGLEKFVDLSHTFIGKDALVKKKPEKKIVYLVSETRQAPRHGYKILDGEIEVGYITSGCFSPVLQKGIGVGYVKADMSVNEKMIVYGGDTGRCVKIICDVVSKKELVKLTGIKR